MFDVSVVLDLDVLAAVQETARQARPRMRRGLGVIARGKTAQLIIRELSTEPGKPRYPIRWKSQRQRRFVMAMLRRIGQADTGYIRTHRLSQGWTIVLDDITASTGVFRIVNNNRAVPYVQGDFAQPYHLDTGWPQAAPVIRKYEDQLQSEVIDVWHRVVSL
jgi:hypothetical protein